MILQSTIMSKQNSYVPYIIKQYRLSKTLTNLYSRKTSTHWGYVTEISYSNNIRISYHGSTTEPFYGQTTLDTEMTTALYVDISSSLIRKMHVEYKRVAHPTFSIWAYVFTSVICSFQTLTLSKFSNSKNKIFEGLMEDWLCQISSLVKYRRNKQTKQTKTNKRSICWWCNWLSPDTHGWRPIK